MLQREFLSTYRTIEGLTKAPRVFDVDDAIFLRRGGEWAREIARRCDLVLAGNSFIGSFFEDTSAVRVIPTAVDTERYRPPPTPSLAPERQLVIGWIGTSANLTYLEGMDTVLTEVLRGRRSTVLRVICDRAPTFGSVDALQVEYRPWSAGTEVADIQTFDVGIMPLANSDWARGKCSYKMLQYMACGKPVVVSPIGMNGEVLALGEVGFGATTADAWIDSLGELIESPGLRARMGMEGRRLAIQHYSVEAIAPLLAAELRGLCA